MLNIYFEIHSCLFDKLRWVIAEIQVFSAVVKAHFARYQKGDKLA